MNLPEGWYQTFRNTDPKGSYIADLAEGGGYWDRPIKFGICDLTWCPGWTLPDIGWRFQGFGRWPR